MHLCHCCRQNVAVPAGSSAALSLGKTWLWRGDATQGAAATERALRLSPLVDWVEVEASWVSCCLPFFQPHLLAVAPPSGRPAQPASQKQARRRACFHAPWCRLPTPGDSPSAPQEFNGCSPRPIRVTLLINFQRSGVAALDEATFARLKSLAKVCGWLLPGRPAVDPAGPAL
ncbi:hypothetical protein ABPG75_001293 [Micractinium tetrahymenae]